MQTPLCFNEIINKYRYLIYAIAIGVVNDAHLAEDISQDVFERLIKNADTVLMLEENKQKAYISTVAKNRAIDVSKKEKTQLNIIDKMKVTTFVAMDSMMEHDFTDEYGFSLEVGELIGELDDLERDIIMLKYGYGYTLRNIAELLGQKDRYIYYKSKTAHDKLRKIIVDGGA